MPVQRAHVDIFLEMLVACETPTPPTTMMFAVNISWTPLKSYVGFLLEKGLLEKMGPPRLGSRFNSPRNKRIKYRLVTTVKGNRVLDLVKSSEVGSLFGYTKWLKEEG